MMPELLRGRLTAEHISLVLDQARAVPPPARKTPLRVAWAGVDDDGHHGHTTTWRDGLLVDWEARVAEDAHVLLSSDGRVRIDDWVGGCLAEDTPLEKNFDGWEVSGIPDACVTVLFGASGRQDYLFRWSDKRLSVSATDETDASVRFSLRYTTAMDWLWGDLLLGHLISNNTLQPSGDLFALSAVEGVVSAPTIDGPPKTRIDTLRSLATLFDSGAFDRVADSARHALSRR